MIRGGTNNTTNSLKLTEQICYLRLIDAKEEICYLRLIDAKEDY